MKTDLEAFLDRHLSEIRRTLLERAEVYGPPEHSFSSLQVFWSRVLGQEISLARVALLLALLKIARLAWGEPQPDSWIDLAGYAILGAYLQGQNR